MLTFLGMVVAVAFGFVLGMAMIFLILLQPEVMRWYMRWYMSYYMKAVNKSVEEFESTWKEV